MWGRRGQMFGADRRPVNGEDWAVLEDAIVDGEGELLVVQPAAA